MLAAIIARPFVRRCLDQRAQSTCDRRSSVVPEERGRPVLGGKGPAASEPGGEDGAERAGCAKHLRMPRVSVGELVCDQPRRRE
jgi:hypothetical protein